MRALDKNRALVVFSGGQDSSIALAWALDRYSHVETIGFDYGQRHAIELGARRAVRRELTQKYSLWESRLGADTLIDATSISELGETAMTHDTEIKIADDGLPTTFVPGRNLFFLVMAGGLAYRRNIGALVAGMCETDYSGYPDCRSDTLRKQMEAIRLGMDAEMSLETPLMSISKGESWRLAHQLGGDTLVELINEHSHSCYKGVRATRHEWGYGCGECPACVLRANGWRDYSGGAAA